MQAKVALASPFGCVSDVVQFQIMKLLLTALLVAFAFSATAVAQSYPKPHGAHAPRPGLDATKILPQAYKLQFENDWVRIVRVHYDAKATLPEHEHPAGVTVYLYFNASDGVLFAHDDASAPVLRPPVRPGSIRVGNGPLEYHTVTNNAAAPSDFVRILLKTEVDQKVARPNARMTPDRMEYDHPSLRVARLNVQPGTKTRIEAKNYPLLRIAWIPDKNEWRLSTKEGYRFLEKGTTEEFEVSGNVPMQLVTIEMRTPIAKAK